MTKFIGTRIRLPRMADAPSAPLEADLYYNTTDDKIYVYTGAAWVEVGSGGGSGIYYQSSAPATPEDGDIWIDSDDEVASVTSVTDSTSTTSSTVAASATAVKSAYDLANGAIAKSTLTTTGDIIYASAANTPARLGIGSTGHMLMVSGGVMGWARQNVMLVASGTLNSDSYSIGVSNLPQGWKNLRVILTNARSASSSDSYIQVQFNNSYNNFVSQALTLDTSGYYPWYGSGFYLSPGIQPLKDNTWHNSAHYEINIFNYSSTTLSKNGHYLGGGQSADGRVQWSSGAFHWDNTAAITDIVFATTNQFSAGTTIEVYGEGAF